MEPVKIHSPSELFEPAETQTFRGVAQLGEVTVGADEYRFSEPCTWVVEVTNTGGALLLRGNVQAEGICACSRCLEDASISFDGIIEGYLVISTEGCDDDLETDEFSLLPEDHDIDLAPLILQGLLLDAPAQPLCQEECKGICPMCGHDLNKGECACVKEDGFADAANPFAVLKGLDLS